MAYGNTRKYKKKSFRKSYISPRKYAGTKGYVKAYLPTDGAAEKQAMIYRYPFSTATTIPKIPDGCADNTIGLSYVNVSTTVGKTSVILYPGMNAWGCSRRLTSVVAADKQMQIHTQNHMDLCTDKPLEETTEDYILEQGKNREKFETNWAKWRLVSCGIRIKCINNDQENDGIWKAVRIPVNKENYAKIIVSGSDLYNGKVIPEFGFTTDIPSTHWIKNDTFQHGKIKDLYKFEGRLKPLTMQHKWKECTQKLPFKYTDTIGEGNLRVIPKSDEHFSKTRELSQIEDTIDDNWDAILIEISGKDHTKTLVTTKCNYEMVPSRTSLLAQYASECKYTPKLVESKFNQYRLNETLPLSYIN